jgi:hypothetical protein
MQLTNSEDARLYENMGFLEFGSPFMQAWTSGVVSPTSGVINGELLHEVKPGPALEKAMRQSHESVAQGKSAARSPFALSCRRDKAMHSA